MPSSIGRIRPALLRRTKRSSGSAHRALDEALAILEPLANSPPADPEISGQAQIAQSIARGTLGRHAEALSAANAAIALVTEDRSRALALIARAVAYRRMGQLEAALADNEQATPLTRKLRPEALGNALIQRRFHQDGSRTAGPRRGAGGRGRPERVWTAPDSLESIGGLDARIGTDPA